MGRIGSHPDLQTMGKRGQVHPIFLPIQTRNVEQQAKSRSRVHQGSRLNFLNTPTVTDQTVRPTSPHHGPPNYTVLSKAYHNTPGTNTYPSHDMITFNTKTDDIQLSGTAILDKGATFNTISRAALNNKRLTTLIEPDQSSVVGINGPVDIHLAA